MANALSSTAKSAWAEHSSSGSLGSPTLRVTGKADNTAAWKRVQEQACRAIVSDPDIVFYLAFLASNRAYKAASALPAQLDALVLSAEGSSFATAPVSVPDSSVVMGSMSPDAIQRASDALVQRALTASAGSKLGKRQAVRGAEALAEYRAGLDIFLIAYKELIRSVVLLSNLYPFSFSGYRARALEVPLARAEAAMVASYSPEAASSFVAQNAAAAAALTMVGREPSLEYRISYDQVFDPPSAEAQVSGTTVTFTKGTPDLVFARVGDVLTAKTGTTAVTAVGATILTLESPLAVSGAFRVVPRALADLVSFTDTLRLFISNTVDVTPTLREELCRLDTAASVNSVILRLAQIQASLSGISPTVSGVLSRRGIDPPTAIPLQNTLLAYAPSLPKKTREAALAIVDLLEQNGFAYAASCVLSGDPTVLLASADTNYPGAHLGTERGAITNAGDE